MKYLMLAVFALATLVPADADARPRRKVTRTVVVKKTCKVVNGIRICR